MKKTTGKWSWRVERTLGWLKVLACALAIVVGDALMADSETVNGCDWNYWKYGAGVEVVGVAHVAHDMEELLIPWTLAGVPVTRIGNGVFAGFYLMRSVEIPFSVTSIGDRAFYGCSGLRSVTIPFNVTSIGDDAFYGCSGLRSVTIPGNVTSIGERAFEYCRGLTSVTMPSSGTNVGSSAFAYCTNLTSVTIPSGVTRIECYTFVGCSNLVSVVIPSGVTDIDYRAFKDCSSLTSVEIPSSVTNIGEEVFLDCGGLTSVTIPFGVTCIREGTFSGCGGLTSVSIPSSVRSIKGMAFSQSLAFSGCSNITDVAVSQSVCSLGLSSVFPDAYAKIAKVVIADGATRIDGKAFRGCIALKSVSIPNSMESIAATAFDECDDMLRDTETVDGVELVDGWVVGYTRRKARLDLTGIRGIADSAFLNGGGLTSVIVPQGISNIPDSAFKGCAHLRSVALPSSVTNIAASAFNGCSTLLTMDLPIGLTAIADGMFDGCSGLESVDIPTSVTRISANAFRNCAGLTSFVIPAGVTYIGAGAFSGCTGLKSVALPVGTTNIVDRLFYGCSGLASITLPDTVTRIGAEAFRNCSSLSEIVIPDSVSEVGANAFGGCSSLSTATIPMCLCDGAFKEAFSGSAVKNLVVSDGVSTIGEYAFKDCTGLETVTIPASVETILDGAFGGCTGVVSVHFGGDAPYIESDCLPPNAILYVSDGAKGWDLDSAGKWFGHEVRRCQALPSGSLSVAGWSGKYDGEAHGVSVTVASGVAGATVKYASASGGPYSSVKPTLTDAGTMTTWCVVSAPGFAPLTNSATVAVSRRSVTLTSGRASKAYDGTALTCRDVSVGGDGFAPGEGATFTVTGSQTAVGSSANAFTYALKSDTKAANYEIATSFGTLTVTGASGGGTGDDWDPADDVPSGGTLLTPTTAVQTHGPHALDSDDRYDFFRISLTAGRMYTFETTGSGDTWGELFSSASTNSSYRVAYNDDGGDGNNFKIVYTPTVSRTYYLRVRAYYAGSSLSYTLKYASASGGAAVAASALKFAKTAVSVKESAAYVDVTVNRVAKDGRVRVRYATEDETAEAGEDYVETSGVLEWADGDKKAKKIRVPLIPDLVAAYDGVPSKTFTVRLEPLGADELDGDERLADVFGGDTCTVTVTETSKANVTVESVYAKKAAKRATVKKDEDVPLWSGSFHGILEEDGGVLTNGAPRIATCSVTVSKGAKPSISAKVRVAGKTYSFSGKGWDADEWDDEAYAYVGERTLTRTWKKNGVTYVDELVLSFDGVHEDTSDYGAWQRAGGSAELLLNVPDAKGSGVQPDIWYVGSLRRDNSKIQDYLDAAYAFAGYYTVSLSPDTSIGNGYLTLTIDNKGKAKVAGMLADGALKPSVSAAACRVEGDSSSANGWSMRVDVCHSTATVCLGGTLRLYAVEDESNPDGSGVRVVVDSSGLLAWYDDSATGCVAMYGDGECISLAPCGGWYDKVVNLQRHYLDYALSVETADVSEFPADELPNGYDYAWDASPSGFGLALSGDKVTYDKRKIVKTNRLTDFNLSTNVCNVSVKLARATGLVTGGFSLWSATEDGAKQKEMTGFKTYGVLLLARDPSAPLDERVIAPGFATKKVKTTYYDDNGKKKTLTWPFSTPFNIVGD